MIFIELSTILDITVRPSYIHHTNTKKIHFLMKNILFFAYLAAMFACTNTAELSTTQKYPPTKKVDTVTNYFGAKVADPYRWLENDTTKETKQWVKDENEVTFAYLHKIPYRDKIKKRLEQIYNYERLTAPFKEGDYYYFYKNDGLQ